MTIGNARICFRPLQRQLTAGMDFQIVPGIARPKHLPGLPVNHQLAGSHQSASKTGHIACCSGINSQNPPETLQCPGAGNICRGICRRAADIQNAVFSQNKRYAAIDGSASGQSQGT